VRIVIGEDLFLLREGLVRLLTAHGFEVVAAVASAPELLRALVEERPDVGIVDVRLPPTFTDEDLRFRQLARRRQPAVHAVVFFMLDVSGSMSDRDRKLAKTFFFWVVQGLRREYRSMETLFVAHTTEAWEFNEPDFFQVSGTGGTVASSGLAKVREIIDARYNPGRCNIYLFYASDGDNSVSDAADARGGLTAIAADAWSGIAKQELTLISQRT